MCPEIGWDASEVVSTKQITLRSTLESDLRFLFELRRDLKLQSLLLTVPDSLDVDSLNSWIVRRETESGGGFLVVANSSNQPIGYTQITQVHRRNGTGYGGIVLASNMRGKGIGRLALRELLMFSKVTLGLRKLLAEIRADNANSIRLHLAIGYRMVGTLQQNFVDDNGLAHDVILFEKILEAVP